MSNRKRSHRVLVTRRACLRSGLAALAPILPSVPRAQIASAALLAGANSPFEEHHYRPIDAQRAAKEQAGSNATVRTDGTHLYSWKVQVGNRTESLDFVRAVQRQYGEEWSLVRVGVGHYDWRAVSVDMLPYVVLPVLAVASDRFFDYRGVEQALACLKSGVAHVQLWYHRQVGNMIFRLLRPLVIPTDYDSRQWNDFCHRTTTDATRFILVDKALEQYAKHLPPPGPNVRVVIAPYAAGSADVIHGAAAQGAFAVIPAFGAAHQVPLLAGQLNERQEGVTYSIGHELGHTFGMDHSKAVYPNRSGYDRCVMEGTAPPQAILLSEEMEQLRRSPYFNRAKTPTLPKPVNDAERRRWLGKEIRLESSNLAGHFVRHRFGLGEMTRIASDLDRKDAAFRLVAGLANNGRPYVSLESVNFPKHYLRHEHYRIKLSKLENNELFRRDATFRWKTGLADSRLHAFEAVNEPRHYLRHSDFHLWVAAGHDQLFCQDATFRIRAAS